MGLDYRGTLPPSTFLIRPSGDDECEVGGNDTLLGYLYLTRGEMKLFAHSVYFPIWSGNLGQEVMTHHA